MEPRTPTRRDGQRALTGAVLVGVLLALLLGAFHPLGLTGPLDGHVCQVGGERHVEAAHDDHDHDPSTCSFCHLQLEVVGDLALDPPALAGLAPTGDASRPAEAAAPTAGAPTSFRSRAPPAA